MRKTLRITALGMSALVPVFGCHDLSDADAERDVDGSNDELRSAPRPTDDDHGVRRFASAPNYRASICPDGTSCTTIDVNRDGREDLVRFDPFGLVGPAGQVSVAYSNGWNFGPMESVADDFCQQGDDCLATDVTGDGRPDLIRFRRYLGEVHLSASTIGGQFEPPVLYAHDLCWSGQTCTAGDVTGDGRADLIAFVGSQDQFGSVRVYPAGFGLGGQPVVWAEGLCMSQSALCRLGDVDGDGRVDLIELSRDGSGQVKVARSLGQGFGGLETWASGVCPSGAECELRDFNGDLMADVIASVPEAQPNTSNSCSGACGGAAQGCWCDELCTQYGDCCADYQAICVNGATCEGHCGGASSGCWCDDLCTQYGDCCSDYEPQCQPPALSQHIEISISLLNGFAPPLVLFGACGAGDRCWTADVTGDGRADLLRIDPSGVLELFPSQDVIDRMEDAALRLSMIRTDFERRRRAWERRELERLLATALPVSPVLSSVLPERFPPAPPPASPTPSDPGLPIDPLPGLEPWPSSSPGAIDPVWMLDQAELLGLEVEAEATAILDAVPSEGSLVWTAEQQRWLTALGRVVAARTAVYAPALAASAVTRDRCHNAILHDRIDEDGVVRVEGSYLARFYGGLLEHEPDGQVWRALPALTGIVEGMRCLSEPELAGLEAGYVEAVSKTMQDLLDRGQPALAKLIWDQALPIELILFDGVKHYTAPQGWRLLQTRIEGGNVELPELPEPGSDFAQYYVEDGATCSTVRCQLYKTPPDNGGARQLILDTLGAWLPDLTEREKLRRSSLYPEHLLDALIDLRRLGEGDCALIELDFFHQTCKSRRTCEFADELAAMPNTLDLALLPGDPGSPFTHFGTERASLDAVNGCGSSGGGGTPPSACFGPELRGRRGRFFPLDPELDRIMSCTLESFTGSSPTTSVVPVEMQLNPECLLMDPANDGSTPPPPDQTVTATKENLEHAQQEAAKFYRTGEGEAETKFGYDREQMVTAIVDKTGATREQVIKAMEIAANDYLGVSGYRTLNNGDPMGTYVGRDGNGALTSMTLGVDPATFDKELGLVEGAGGPIAAQEYLLRGFVHEGVHMVLRVMEDRGWGAPAANIDAAHAITGRLGLTRVARSCAADSSSCRSGCGFSDARIQRFTECIDAADPTPIDRCAFAEDYCTERSLGVLDFNAGSGCGAPVISFPPMCAVVSCDTGSAVTSACCGGGGGGGTPPSLYPSFSPDPGPHPGDPDGFYGGIPGGPGGVPFPPVPFF
ncbi:MAG: FG-GAP-like repeat-containing protein [Enhygromyxa sp.]